jgi:hypothetical protein
MSDEAKLVAGGAWLADWMRRVGMSKPKVCEQINSRYMERTGKPGKLSRAGLYRYMVGARTPSVDWAVSIHAVTGCPVGIWTKSAHAPEEAH